MSSAPSAGQKVTKDPRAGNRINEAVGVVTSDSLAAESMNAHGSFGAGNPHAAPMKQPSKSTNTNNTDTSAAIKLDAAPNSALRDEAQPFKGTAELDSRGHARQDSGVGPNRTPRERDGGTGGAEIVEDKRSSNTSGSNKQSSKPSGGNTSGSKKKSSNTSGKNTTSNTGPSKQASNVAPTASYEKDGSGAVSKVKGKNLKSGDAADFKGDEPNASFNAEVGTEDDPGRRAVEQMQYRNTRSAHDTAQPEKGISAGGVYDALKSDEQV